MKKYNTVGFNNPSDISHILEKIQKLKGPQRANRYRVEFVVPDAVQNPYSDVGTDSIIATMVQLPQRSINYFSDSVGAFSPYWDVPLKVEFDDHFIINFLVDQKWKIRKFIDSWMAVVSGSIEDNLFFTGTGARLQTIGSYQGSNPQSIGINAAANQATRIDLIPEIADPTDPSSASNIKISLYQVWPKLILPSQFDTNANNIPMTMSVDFSYRYYRINEMNGTQII